MIRPAEKAGFTFPVKRCGAAGLTFGNFTQGDSGRLTDFNSVSGNTVAGLTFVVVGTAGIVAFLGPTAVISAAAGGVTITFAAGTFLIIS